MYVLLLKEIIFNTSLYQPLFLDYCYKQCIQLRHKNDLAEYIALLWLLSVAGVIYRRFKLSISEYQLLEFWHNAIILVTT